MIKCKGQITILVAEDDEDDRMLIKDAVNEVCDCGDLRFVNDGDDVLDYLLHRNQFRDITRAPCPDLILMDLVMPRRGGLEVLREIRSDPDFKTIPVLIFSSSEEEKIVAQVYGAGANAYIVKPSIYEGLLRVMRTLTRYWCEVATLPPKRPGCLTGFARKPYLYPASQEARH
jgi:CheY-like chemotaxis protein